MYKQGDICPICGSGPLKATKSKEDFEYKGHILSLELTSYSCDVCSESFFDNEEMKANQKTVKDFQRRVDGLLTSDEIKKIRQKYGLSQRKFARILGVGEKSFTKYELGLVSQSRGMDNLLRLIDEIPENLSLLKRYMIAKDKDGEHIVTKIVNIEKYKLKHKKSSYRLENTITTENTSNEYQTA